MDIHNTTKSLLCVIIKDRYDYYNLSQETYNAIYQQAYNHTRDMLRIGAKPEELYKIFKQISDAEGNIEQRLEGIKRLKREVKAHKERG